MQNSQKNNPEWLEKRNDRLYRFWKRLGLPVRFIGQPNSPAMVFDNRWILSCYVHNFDLVFMDKNDGGNTLFSIKLTESPMFSPSQIMIWLSESAHRPIYRIRVVDSSPKLFLSGYNYLDSGNSEGRYPVFANKNPKIYFTEESAQERASTLINEGYKLIIVKPSSSHIDFRKYKY
jgi:hypothetical protein